MRDKTKCECYIEWPAHKQVSDFVRGYVYGRTGRELKETDTYLQGYCLGTREVEECTCGGDPRKCNFMPMRKLYAEDDDWSLMRELDIMGSYEND